MANLETKYLGLNLKNPVIVSSSGLTGSIGKIEQLAKSGAGAVVLKSLFEEQIHLEAGSMLKNADYPEAEDYINNYARDNALDEYLKLISEAKAATDIPVIASISCVGASEWVSFAEHVQQAGADAIELNVYILANDVLESGSSYEQIYYDILDAVTKKVTIPISMKLGQHYSNIPSLVNNLYGRGAKGVVLFNRFYAPDIDLNNMSFTSAEVFSRPADIRQSLRWVGIVSSLVKKIDICASTGVHDGQAVIKQILAGAKAVQVCSVLYKKGPAFLQEILKEMNDWMEKKNFEDLHELRGRMSYKNIPDPSIFERAQFMKYYSNFQ